MPPTILLLLWAIALSACASVATNSDPRVAGTWRFFSVDGQKVSEPFYLQLNANGTASSWPAPKQWSNEKGVSQGKYSVSHGYFVFRTGMSQNPKARLQVRESEMILTSDEGHRVTYHRVAAGLKPGYLENGQLGGYRTQGR